jgi:HD-GYP domain-containing protein (c-di-GMP phosphodiesterase class II)
LREPVADRYIVNDFAIIIDILGLLVLASALVLVFVLLPLNTRKAAVQSYIAMARAVETREPHLLGQSEQTARYATIMAWMSLSMWPTEIVRLETAALMHTLGKVGVPFALLNSPQSLCSISERYVVREYVRIGAAMLDAVPGLRDCAPAVLYHREYIDGSGYPFGRFGDAIPLPARILCVASEFVALTSPRIYRAGLAALKPEAALRHLRRHAGERYDKRCVALLGIAHHMITWQTRLSKPLDTSPLVRALRPVA